MPSVDRDSLIDLRRRVDGTRGRASATVGVSSMNIAAPSEKAILGRKLSDAGWLSLPADDRRRIGRVTGQLHDPIVDLVPLLAAVPSDLNWITSSLAMGVGTNSVDGPER